METAKQEKKQRFHVYLFPSVKRRMRQLAFDREQSMAALLNDAVIIGLDEIRKQGPPKPAA